MSNEDQNKKVMSASEFFNQSNGINTTHSQQTINNSGRGKEFPVPDTITKRFNWGAFLLTWIWGLGNNSYITLLIFATILISWIPIIGWLISLGLSIWFGIKGNEWAWQNKHFDNIDEFHSYQKKWTIAGVIVYCALIPLIIGVVVAMTLPVLMSNTPQHYSHAFRLKNANTLSQVTMTNESIGEKCELSSEGIAKCFKKSMGYRRIGNTIYTNDGSVWTFNGNGICKNNGDCKVTIEFNNGRKTDITSIPLYVNSKGFLYVEENDIKEYTK